MVYELHIYLLFCILPMALADCGMELGGTVSFFVEVIKSQLPRIKFIKSGDNTGGVRECPESSHR